MNNTDSHQDRVRAEKSELDGRLAKLDAFILDNPAYRDLPEAEQVRLNKQSLVVNNRQLKQTAFDATH